MKTYHMAIETFEKLDGWFRIVKVQAASVKDTVLGYLEYESDADISDELTVEGEAGRFAGEEASIGIGTSEEVAALQYFKVRMEQG